ncbi:hypothetical protein F5884DRAFT_888367 [Xylogone sp. PMI_703]|nr:hypothetical protein F5884DRAFT_888367 [Xylogone sp. PMI_703]
MSRYLEASDDPDRNVLLYDDHGRIVGGLWIRDHDWYITWRMLYWYCDMIFILPDPVSSIKPTADETPHEYQTRSTEVEFGGARHYKAKTDGTLTVNLSTERVPRRVLSGSSSQTQSPGRVEKMFREGLRERDQVCAISGEDFRVRGNRFHNLEAAHIYPVALVEEWNQQGYRRWITDTSPSTDIGKSKLYSLQNGLLLSLNIHGSWDIFAIGVDPDDGFKVICFNEDSSYVGNRRLGSTINCSDPNHRVSPGVLRWHFRMCVLRNMRGDVCTPPWEYDLGPDDIGEIPN